MLKWVQNPFSSVDANAQYSWYNRNRNGPLVTEKTKVVLHKYLPQAKYTLPRAVNIQLQIQDFALWCADLRHGHFSWKHVKTKELGPVWEAWPAPPGGMEGMGGTSLDPSLIATAK